MAPIYTNFFKSLGATTQNSNLAQIFTLMENGTVNGYGWPVIGHRPGWDKVTKYRVDPGFYDVDILILANASAWDKLSDKARAILNKAALEIEAIAMEKDAPMAAGAGAKQLKSGFEQINFDGKDGEFWSGKARDAGWAGVNKVSPEHGPELRKLFAKCRKFEFAAAHLYPITALNEHLVAAAHVAEWAASGRRCGVCCHIAGT